MLPAILTSVFFALSGVTGQKTAVRLGSLWGNFIRLFIAVVVLGILVWGFSPKSIRAEPFSWFFISGMVGFGIGDIALFLAYERIGSRLSILLNLCLAPVFALFLEWLWLGNGVTALTVLAVLVILTGVVMAIRPGAGFRQRMERHGNFGLGILAAITAGLGQGSGAVISRKAESIVRVMHMEVDGVSAAFQRVVAGWVIAGIAVAIVKFLGPRELSGRWRSPFQKGVMPWLLGASLFGPVIGVSFFQWALQTRESGVVLAIVSITPIVMMPMAALTEGDHPRKTAVAGAFVAVSGVILLHVWGG